MNLTERIEAAITRITDGRAPMRIPADQTDPDLVLAACRDRIAELEGLKPELPPRPPELGGASQGGLPRYGLRWNGPQQPLAVPMADGYWTPWHIAAPAREALSTLMGQGHVLKYAISFIENWAEDPHFTSPENRKAELARVRGAIEGWHRKLVEAAR